MGKGHNKGDLCVDIHENRVDSGTNVRQWDCKEEGYNNNQKFRLVKPQGTNRTRVASNLEKVFAIRLTWPELEGVESFNLAVNFKNHSRPTTCIENLQGIRKDNQFFYIFYGKCNKTDSGPGTTFNLNKSEISSFELSGIVGGQAKYISTAFYDRDSQYLYFSFESKEVYILMGQSNMAGFTPYSHDPGPKGIEVPINVEYYSNGVNGDNRITNFNVGTNAHASSDYSFYPFAFGPELSFIQEMSARKNDKNIIVIKYAVGGTSMSDWLNSYDGGLSLFERAKAFVELKLRGQRIEVKGFFWMQGEQDGVIRTSTHDYKLGLIELINRCRNQMIGTSEKSIPFILGKVFDYENDANSSFSNIRAAQLQTAHSMSNVFVIDLDNFVMAPGDPWHFSAPSQLSFGKCMVESFFSTRDLVCEI